MRIIAGKYSSRRLTTLKGDATRPTLDKVKEAVFSSLGGMFDGGMVLDLYSGSGAIGLEAISRGFDQAVLVDMSHAAVSIIHKNAEALQCEEQCEILCMRDFRALEYLKNQGMVFDLVYLDPPYRKQKNHEVLAYLDAHHMVHQGGRVVIESLKEEEYHDAAGALQYDKESIYGIMKITYYRNR
ncbi:MAG: 16S rRNA (guanine(966)-N(2))-methyltransferase RsmD [Solobacterium sp.]|jgi:16S rRNA (guanine966-N2)-methyltransferase|nr:16S rRNA (guanine(966)-N(2))-methyltransferase RsmD [Solobacterium sp.]MCH4047842.1 16S rRNA (guanine(966)-N(2))-methyltransferase RsmD [Solobacterium sp.]MCH4075572.1 16S rRNA (guanine(966)-N(2))-methyltransferase RsmD [Solobacterium sp.]MCI1313232.1 16S rRNA (guanine(966)-N(2))-methyltransferase RsmD [Solobacterium sp.]MCI1346002.1 16S rRNA (guanine(966)-N(2))-methyltransferase RsmD [Solobacterium sp.]